MAFAASRGRSSARPRISANWAPSQQVPATMAAANQPLGPRSTAAIAATSTQPASDARASVADCAPTLDVATWPANGLSTTLGRISCRFIVAWAFCPCFLCPTGKNAHATCPMQISSVTASAPGGSSRPQHPGPNRGVERRTSSPVADRSNTTLPLPAKPSPSQRSSPSHSGSSPGPELNDRQTSRAEATQISTAVGRWNLVR